MSRMLLCLLLFFVLHASARVEPWFTGPLLAPAGITLPSEHINIEPYYTYSDGFGIYNNHWKVTKIPTTITNSANPVITFGLTDRIDLQTTMPYYVNSKDHRTTSNASDITGILGYQAIRQANYPYLPNLRMTLMETVPSGQFESLDPANLQTDSTGAGGYQTALGLNFQYLSMPIQDHYLRTRFVLSYNFTSTVKLHGYNTYGGGIGTLGTINPGQQFQADLAFEYQVTQNWVPVFEINYVYRQPSSFRGNPGHLQNGKKATVGHGIIDLLSLAPAIEYNVNSQLGVIVGPWFTVKGRNSPEFLSIVCALNYFI